MDGTAMDDLTIDARGVCKSFGNQLVLDDVTLAVEEGTILSLLGPNGAGKTTMVRILSTLIPADSGSHAYGRPRRGHRSRRGAGGHRGHRPVLGRGQSAHRDREPAADGRPPPPRTAKAGRRRVTELLEQFDLTDAADKPLSTYSGGMRRRLDLAMTLVGRPRVIFLDEPTTGLDPRSRRTMWEIIRELAAAGVTIFLTTQYLDEADQLADRIAVLDQGRIVAEGTPAELKRRIPGGHVRLQFADPRPLRSASQLLPDGRARPGPAGPAGAGRRHRGLTARTCSTSCTTPTSRSSGCPSTPRTWTTCSSPSPARPSSGRRGGRPQAEGAAQR